MDKQKRSVFNMPVLSGLFRRLFPSAADAVKRRRKNKALRSEKELSQAKSKNRSAKPKLTGQQKALAMKAALAKADPRVPLAEGTMVGTYKLLNIIGRGSFSLVYGGIDVKTGNKIVVKEYYPKRFSRRHKNKADVQAPGGKGLRIFEAGFEQFFNEAIALSKIRHPHILQSSDLIRTNNTAYLAAKFTGGHDLKWFLAATKAPLDQKLIYRIFLPILSALNFLHSSEFLHLDVKPANILLQPNAKPLLLDMGAAQSFTSTRRVNNFQTLTHGFAPPEQYDKKEVLGPWTDVYAIAATIYCCIVCKPPSRAYKSHNESQLDIRAHEDNYNEGMIYAVNQALSLNVVKRCESIDDFTTMFLDGTEWDSLYDYERSVMGYDRFSPEALGAQKNLVAAFIGKGDEPKRSGLAIET